MRANEQTTDQLTAELEELRQRVAELEQVEARYQKSLEDLQKTEDMYQDLYDNAPDMYVSVEPEKGTIIRCNQTLATALGYTKSQIVGRPILEVYDPDCLAGCGKIHGEPRLSG